MNQIPSPSFATGNWNNNQCIQLLLGFLGTFSAFQFPRESWDLNILYI